MTADLLTSQGIFARGGALDGLGHDIDRPDPVFVELWGTASDSAPATPLSIGGRELRMPTSVLEDVDALMKQRQRRAADLAQAIESQCRAQAKPQRVSPLYSALLAAVGSLKNNCPSSSECVLIVQSDLKETKESGVTAAVESLARGRAAAAPGRVLPPPIDLEKRISVFVCGYGASTEVVSERARGAIVKFWRDRVLVNAKHWAEQSICPGYAVP
jgi:hypothetical protein